MQSRGRGNRHPKWDRTFKLVRDRNVVAMGKHTEVPQGAGEVKRADEERIHAVHRHHLLDVIHCLLCPDHPRAVLDRQRREAVAENFKIAQCSEKGGKLNGKKKEKTVGKEMLAFYSFKK